MPSDTAALPKVLRRQYGVIAREQALTCGLSRHAIQYRIRQGGPWQVVFAGVYLTTTGAPSTDQRDTAALLFAGPDSVLTGIAALRRFGLRVNDNRTADVLVPAGFRRRSQSYVTVHQTDHPADPVLVHGPIRFALPTRAVVDAARQAIWAAHHVPPRRGEGAAASQRRLLAQVRALIAGVVQQGACGIADLRAEVESGTRRDTALILRVLAEVDEGIRSAPEGDLMDLVKAAGLPVPMFNPRLYLGAEFLAQPDAWWPRAGVAGEVDSREWHLAPADWERTMRRHDRMTAAGIRVLHFSPAQLRSRPDEVVALIRAAISTGSPVPGIRTIHAGG